MTEMPRWYSSTWTRNRITAERESVVHGIGLAAVMLTLLWHWFAVADRYAVFLYNHVDGPWYGPATPFDPITSTRYWMSGFVAAAVASIVYSALVLAGARCRGSLWQVWLAGAMALSVAVPAIVRTQNTPTLPPNLAAAVTLAALTGLAIGLVPAMWAAAGLDHLAWMLLDGLGLLPVLLGWRAIELPARGMMAEDLAIGIAAASIVAGAAWFGLRGWVRSHRHRAAPGAVDLVLAGLWWGFLAVPLIHHTIFTPPAFRYITSAQNIFGFAPTTALTAGLLAIGVAASASACGRIHEMEEREKRPAVWARPDAVTKSGHGTGGCG